MEERMDVVRSLAGANIEKEKMMRGWQVVLRE